MTTDSIDPRPSSPPWLRRSSVTPSTPRTVRANARRDQAERAVEGTSSPTTSTPVDELIATVTGIIPRGPRPHARRHRRRHFRGFFAKNSVCLYPELEDSFYNSRFIEEVKSYWDAQYAKPTLMLFNICGPHHTGLAPTSTPSPSAGSGSRTRRCGCRTSWASPGSSPSTSSRWRRSSPGGTRVRPARSPTGPTAPSALPRASTHPLWNKGVVVQNEMMFHRGDPVGPTRGPRDRGAQAPVAHRLRRRPRTAGTITTDGEVIRRYQPEQIRLLVHWNAEVYNDMDEVKKSMDHSDDLTHDRVIETFLADLRAGASRSPSRPTRCTTSNSCRH